MQQRTVLVIAYHFPPGGGPGVQRVLKHVTYLREMGWRPVVLTVENGDFPARDDADWAGHIDVVVDRGRPVATFHPAPATDGDSS